MSAPGIQLLRTATFVLLQPTDRRAPEAVTKVRLVALKLTAKTGVSSVRSSHSSRRTCRDVRRTGGGERKATEQGLRCEGNEQGKLVPAVFLRGSAAQPQV